MALINQEQAAEHYEAAETHMAGLKKIADLRGGLENLEDDVIAVKICRTDILFAMQQGGHPLFHRNHIHHVKRSLAYKGFNLQPESDAYSGQLDSTLQEAFSDAMGLCRLLNKHQDAKPLDLLEFQEVLVSICYRLLQFRTIGQSRLKQDTQSTYHIGLCLFMTSVYFNNTQDRIARQGLIKTIVKEAIESKFSQHEDDFKFWLLILGGISVSLPDGREWFVEKLREQASLLGIMTWEQVQTSVTSTGLHSILGLLLQDPFSSIAMASTTTHTDFGANTEAIEVAKAFSNSIRGKTVLITGVNRGGIGFATAQAFSPDYIILAGRSPSKAKESINELKAEFPDVDYRFLEVDLSSQESVRNAAKEVLSWSDIPAIDFIINSAGVMAIQERTLSKDGIEMHLATNHIGHWLLSCLLMPKLIKASENKPKGSVRIINVTSGSPMGSNIRWSDMNFDKKNKDLPQEEQPNYEFFKLWGYENTEETAYVPLDGYNRSKVANVLFGIEANKRLFEKHGILTLSAHPGVIMTTELARNFPKETLEAVEKLGSVGFYTHKSVEAGASTSLVAALDPKLANGVGETHEGSENCGAYLADCQISTGATPLAVSSSEAKKLWDFSEEATGQRFSW
ncbi:short chain dehydrogenase reductase [Fusarium sp. NRRL 25303]|nr:short chain dehydrogenase reductase [Fusarium sp. NRRL 25303]